MKIADLRVRLQVTDRQMAAAIALVMGALVYMIAFTNAYFEIPKQLILGWGCTAIIFLMSKSRLSNKRVWRLSLIFLSTFLALRYMYWRTVESLLYTDAFDFFGMALLYLAEMYGFVIYLLGLFVNVWPLESKIVPLPQDTTLWPTVDVLIPTYNEPEDIVRITVTAAMQIDYPRDKIRVYLLDDGATQAKRNDAVHGANAWERHYNLRRMAESLGATYVTRETNQHAKAGNINHALGQSSGDLLLMLDCDHVPTKDILHNTVGHFVKDHQLFLVQTPHFFINPAPIEKSLGGIGDPSTESDLFYRRIHTSLDFWNASYFCGSAAVLRRRCLMEVGGICGTTITEDAETAFHLHSRGYNSVYINKPMVCGLSPESYDDYVSQHSRWAQGMVQLLLLNNPLRVKGLNLSQRVAYFNSSIFWLFSLPRFIYFISPAAYLILNMSVYHASWLQILAFTVPYILTLHMMMDHFYRGTRQPLFSEIYETVQSLFLIPAVLSVLINPWNPSFHVTPKGKLNTKEYLSPVSAPFFLIIAINLCAMVGAVMKWSSQPTARDVIIVTGVWCAFNVFMVMLALGAFWERKQIRKFYRIVAKGSVTVHFARTGQALTGEIRDLSLTGIAFDIAPNFVPREHDHVTLEVRDSYGRTYQFESQIKRLVLRNGQYFCGSEFEVGKVVYADVVAYVFGDSQRWTDVWNRKSDAKGTPKMLWHFAVMGFHAVRQSAFDVLVDALRRLWRLTWRVVTTPVLKEALTMASCWFVYSLYLGLAQVLELLDHKQARKLQRAKASGAAEVYFPRTNATVMGTLTDVSMTGLGILAELPFALEDKERVFVKAIGQDSRDYRFDCIIQRALPRDHQLLFGVEFITDIFVYPSIVKFVHGNGLQMIRATSLTGSGLVLKGRTISLDLIYKLHATVTPLLARIFLNPQAKGIALKEK